MEPSSLLDYSREPPDASGTTATAVETTKIPVRYSRKALRSDRRHSDKGWDLTG